MTDAAKRFPFAGLPKGWFVVALSEEVVAGTIHRMRYFGRDLIAYRGESGTAYVVDAYCPHLGAHLGFGGKIEGDCIRCPFHGWKFSGDGQCVEVPYSDRIPPKAALPSWPVIEQDGVIHVFHDPARGTPWPLPPIETEGWTSGLSILWPGVRSHPQEVFENTVDTAHIGPVHDGRGAHVVEKPEREGEIMRIKINFEASGELVGMPDQINDVHLDVTMRGLGWVYVHTHVRNVDLHARQRIYVTPVDETTIDIRGIIHVRETDDPVYTAELHQLFYQAYCSDFPKDFPIWENKRYLERPNLAKGDGPIGIYRRWCLQFYGEPAIEQALVVPSIDVPVAQLARRSVWRSLIDRFTRARPPIEVDTRPAPRPEDDEDWQTPARIGPTAATTPVVRPPGSSITSAEDYFATLEQRFVPSAAKGIDAVFQWELTGEGGQTFHANVCDGAIAIQRGPHPKPTVALVIDAADYVRVINGDLDGTRAFTTGGGKVKGSVMVAMKMRALFPAAGG